MPPGVTRGPRVSACRQPHAPWSHKGSSCVSVQAAACPLESQGVLVCQRAGSRMLPGVTRGPRVSACRQPHAPWSHKGSSCVSVQAAACSLESQGVLVCQRAGSRMPPGVTRGPRVSACRQPHAPWSRKGSSCVSVQAAACSLESQGVLVCQRAGSRMPPGVTRGPRVSACRQPHAPWSRKGSSCVSVQAAACPLESQGVLVCQRAGSRMPPGVTRGPRVSACRQPHAPWSRKGSSCVSVQAAACPLESQGVLVCQRAGSRMPPGVARGPRVSACRQPHAPWSRKGSSCVSVQAAACPLESQGVLVCQRAGSRMPPGVARGPRVSACRQPHAPWSHKGSSCVSVQAAACPLESQGVLVCQRAGSRMPPGVARGPRVSACRQPHAPWSHKGSSCVSVQTAACPLESQGVLVCQRADSRMPPGVTRGPRVSACRQPHAPWSHKGSSCVSVQAAACPLESQGVLVCQPLQAASPISCYQCTCDSDVITLCYSYSPEARTLARI